MIPMERLDQRCVRLDALRPHLEEVTRNVQARRSCLGPLPPPEALRATFIELASSQANSWHSAVDALHQFRAIAVEKPTRASLESLGRTVKEVAVDETVRFARLMEYTGHWVIFLHGHYPLVPPEIAAVEEENPFTIRES